MSKLDDRINKVLEGDNGSVVMLAVLFVVLLLFTTAASGADTVRLGAVVQTDVALLCRDLDAAKFLSDQVADEDVQMVGQSFFAMGVCFSAGGAMIIDEPAYQGKRYNVFKTHDSTQSYFWVTVVKPQYD